MIMGLLDESGYVNLISGISISKNGKSPFLTYVVPLRLPSSHPAYF